MKRLRNIVLAASLLMGGWQAAMAEDLTIAGLGTLPLDSRISITDGKDNVMMDLFKKETKKRGYGKTARVLMWSMLAVPPGMNLYPEKAPYPYDSSSVPAGETDRFRHLYGGGICLFRH